MVVGSDFKLKIDSISDQGLVIISSNIELTEFLWADLKIIPGKLSDPNDLALNSVTSVSNSSLGIQLQLNFRSPNYVSFYDEFKEKLTITVNGRYLGKEIPKQQGFDAFTISLDLDEGTMTTVVSSLAILSLNPAFMLLLNHLLSIVAELTIVSHFVVLDLHYSTNLQQFFKQIFPLLIFDILPTDNWYESWFSLSEIEDDPKSSKFEEVGY